MNRDRMKEIGNELREMRESSGMTQKEVAKYLGVTRNAIGMYERGDRIPNTLTYEDLLRLYGYSIYTTKF